VWRATYPKAARLRQRKEFLVLQREGRRQHTAHLVVLKRLSSRPISRLGITVSKRIGNAVVRNRVKRLLREVFRRHRRDLAPPVDLLIIAKPGADNLTYAQAATEFARILELASQR
jgi:ribonuclease P protein component